MLTVVAPLNEHACTDRDVCEAFRVAKPSVVPVAPEPEAAPSLICQDCAADIGNEAHRPGCVRLERDLESVAFDHRAEVICQPGEFCPTCELARKDLALAIVDTHVGGAGTCACGTLAINGECLAGCARDLTQH